jgi:gliding motility-associated-like protein/uncharacterized repeat protein (TIGR01451 family)
MKHIYQPFAICRYFLVILVLFSSFIHSVQAQVPTEINSGNPKFPFPQFLPYQADGGHSLGNLGTKNAPGVTHAEMEKLIREAWQIFANGFKYTGQVHQGVKYIRSNYGCPYDCTEGVGYSMIAAAYMGDKTVFDGLWFREHDARMPHPRFIDGVNPYPNYKYGSNTITEVGSDAATDGDVDFALGLLMAWSQWGDLSGYTSFTGEPISYKEEALKVIRGLVERENQELDGNRFDCRSVSGNVGFDGYFKNGNTWGELTNWASNDPTWCPEFKGPQDLHVDYVAPAYFNHFAKFVEEQGHEPEDAAWNINQLLRAEASSDWLVGQHYQNSPTAILSAGWVALDANNKATFTRFNEGEDFRFAWRTALNYMWNGNPTTTWNPVTHQVEAGANTFERDMAIRHAQFLKDPGKAPWSNTCVELGGGPELTYMGPSQLMWTYTPNGLDPSGGQGFPLNWNAGTGSPAAVSAQDYELMGKLYQMCAIEWDIDTPGDGYLTSTPKYFHGFFRILGLMIVSGNHHGPLSLKQEANMKVYLDNDKTYAFTNDLVTFTVSYRNYASIAATDVKVSTTLPNGLEFVSATGGGVNSGNSIEWNVGTVPGYQTSTGIVPTKGEFTFTARIIPKFSGQICPVVSITTTNGTGWTSNEYPNNVTAVMERNCIDIVEKALEIAKTVNYDTVNPGTELIYNVEFENASKGGYINGGRPGVVPAYAHKGTAAEAAEHWIMFRLYHGAAEPLIDYQNYRLSMFLNDNVNTCSVDSDPTCTSGWKLGNATIYEGGDKTKVRIFQEDITPGSDARGAWNQRIVVQFSEQLATVTPHLSRYFGIVGQRVHQGGAEPLRAVWQMSSSTWAKITWDDDWSWNPALNNAEDGLYFPVANDWTDINNPDQPVTGWHNEACEKPTVFAENILVEEWDGYTWRRIYGSGPLPGRDINNVIVTDIIPEGFTFVAFVDENGVELGNTVKVLDEDVTYNPATRTITWTKDRLQIKQKGVIRYKVIADFSTGICIRANEVQTNSASISGDNESPVIATTDVIITCDDIILPPPPSSMTKTSDKANYDVGENIVYTLEYQNTNGSIANADFATSSNWTAQSGIKMNLSGGELTTVSNDAGVTTYNYSHGTNGTIEASVNFQGSAALGFAFRHTGGAKSNGLYIVFKPNPGNGSTEIRLYNGTTQMGTTINAGFPNTVPAKIKLELVDDQVNLWIGSTSNPTPTYTFNGFPVRAGYAGFINGWANDGGDSYGTHRVVSLSTHLDSGFDIQFKDPIPTDVTFVSAPNSGVVNNGILEYPKLVGPVLKDEIITYTWIGTIETCPANGKIVNNAITDVMGFVSGSIASQNIVSCLGSVVCTPPASATISGDDLIVEGSSTVLTATIAPVETGWLYNWYKLPNTTTPLAGSGLDKKTLTVSDSGRYVVRVVSSSTPSCFVESSEYKLSYIETCAARDSVVVVLSELLEPGKTTTLTATPYPAGAGLDYQWFKLPDLTTPLAGSGIDKTILTVSDTGRYIVKLIDPIDPTCEVTSQITIVDYLCEKAVIKAFWNGEEITEPYAINLCEGESGVLAFAPQKYDFEYDIRQLTGTTLLDGVPTPAGDSAKVAISSVNSGSWLLSVYSDPGNKGNQLCWAVTDTKFLTINKSDNPIPIITPTPDSKYCAGENGVTLTANTGVGYTYIWSKDDVEQALGPDPNVQNNATAGNWKVKVMIGGLCSDSTTLDVMEEAKPIAEFTTSATSLSYCPGSSGTNLIAKAASGMQYQFLKDGSPFGVFSTTETQIADEGTWHVVFENEFGCRDTSNAVVVTQSSNITVEIVGDTTICSVQTLSLSTNLGSQTITWTLPDNSTQEVSDLLVSNPVSGLYKAYYEDGSGCSGENSVNVLVEPASPNPVVSILDKSPEGCVGDEITFAAQMVDATDPIIEWYINSDKQNSVIEEFKSSVLQDGDKVKVLITSESKCSGIQKVGDSVQVVINPLPIIEISSATTSICEGESVSLDGASSNTTLDIFEWLKDGNSFSTLPNSVSVSSGGSYSLKGTDIHGCSGLSNALVIEKISLPIATISSPVTGVCSGSQIDISSDVTDQSYTYSWIDASDADLGISGPVATISSPGAYRMVLKSGNCTSISNTVIIEDLVLETPLIYGNNTPLCEAEGETYTVTNLLSNAQYTWSLPAGAQIVNQNGGIAIVNLGDQDGIISVYATNSLGCESPVGEIPVSLQLCGFKAKIDFDKTSICPGESIIFESKSTGVGSATTYQWNFGANATPSTYNQVGPIPVVFNSPGLVQVSLTITENGISDTYTITDKIRIYSNPDVSSIVGPDMLCLGAIGNFSTTVSSDAQVQWSLSSNLDNRDIYTSSSVNVQATQLGIGIIKAYALDMTGCYSETVEKSITIENAPSVSLSSDQNLLCKDGQAVLVATSTSSDIRWYKDEQHLMNELGDRIIVNTPGKYWVSIGSGNCIASDTVYIGQSGLVVDAGKDQMIDIGQSIQLFAISNSPSVSYHWEPGMHSLPAPTVSPYESTLYTVFVTDEHGCQAKDDVLVRVVQPLFIPNAFTPNGDGVHDLWEISGLERFSNLSVEIFNRWGQIVYKSTGTYKPWDGTKNGVMLPVSTYYYVIDGGGGSIPITGSVLLSK